MLLLKAEKDLVKKGLKVICGHNHNWKESYKFQN